MRFPSSLLYESNLVDSFFPYLSFQFSFNGHVSHRQTIERFIRFCISHFCIIFDNCFVLRVIRIYSNYTLKVGLLFIPLDKFGLFARRINISNSSYRNPFNKQINIGAPLNFINFNYWPPWLLYIETISVRNFGLKKSQRRADQSRAYLFLPPNLLILLG